MRRWLVALAVGAALLVLAASAFAVLPAGGTKFKGFVAYSPINGFRDPVTFTVAADRKSLKDFKFGSFGCFGAGGFPPNKNPFTLPGSTLKLASVPVTASGTFKRTASVALSSTPTKVTVKGSFSKVGGKVVASGSVTVSQTFNGQHCGPASIGFSAK